MGNLVDLSVDLTQVQSMSLVINYKTGLGSPSGRD